MSLVNCLQAGDFVDVFSTDVVWESVCHFYCLVLNSLEFVDLGC